MTDKVNCPKCTPHGHCHSYTCKMCKDEGLVYQEQVDAWNAEKVPCPKCDPSNPELDEDGKPYTCYFCCNTGEVTRKENDDFNKKAAFHKEMEEIVDYDDSKWDYMDEAQAAIEPKPEPKHPVFDDEIPF